MRKQFEHNRIERCKICKQEIDTSNDTWCAVLDYDAEVEFGKGFYHIKCLKEYLENPAKAIKKNIMLSSQKILQSIGLPQGM